ncbi:MAG: MlaD family protein [bacterium]|nr:MlaD family protein [bacterium]
MKKETFAGAAALLCIGLFMFFAPNITTRDNEVLAYHYYLLFEQVSGLRPKDPVKIAGVVAGQVESIDFTTRTQKSTFGDDARILVSCAMDYGKKLPVDSRATIGSAMGGVTWLEITPGISKEYIPLKKLFKIKSAPSATDALSKGLSSFRDLNENTKELRTMINDPKLRLALSDAAANARFYTNEIKYMTKDAQKELKEMDSKLDSFQSAAEMQLDRIDVQVLQGQKLLNELMPRFNEKMESWNQRIEASAGKITKLAETAEKETQRYKALCEKAEQMSLPLDDESKQKIHHLAEKLENIADMGEDLQNIAHNDDTKNALKEMIKKYRLQTEKLKESCEKVENKL